MEALAVVINRPESLSVCRLSLTPPGDDDVVVDIAWSGISTGTERLLWQGRMPPFPGMGYPLVPGYESVGHIVAAGPGYANRIGEVVFVPGATCFGEIRGLFGGAASRLVVPAARATADRLHARRTGVLIALAATAQHAIAGAAVPDLIVGHGVLGRLLARLVVAVGDTPARGLGDQSRRVWTGRGLPGSTPRRRYAQRLQMYLRRQRRSGAARHC